MATAAAAERLVSSSARIAYAPSVVRASTMEKAGATEERTDMTRVHEFHDFGVALLAQAIAGRRAATAVMGLHEHHLRLLRYLGIACWGANFRAGVDLA